MSFFSKEYLFPDDIEILENKIILTNREVLYKDVISLKVFSTSSTTSINFVSMGTDVESKLTIFLSSNEKINIKIKSFKQWGPFKNKKNLKKFHSAFVFYDFIEAKTFANRVKNFLIKSNKDVFFRYNDLFFLKNKKITRTNGDQVAAFDINQYEISRDYKKITFKKIKNKSFKEFFFPNFEIDLSTDEDVFLHLMRDYMGLSFKSYNYKF